MKTYEKIKQAIKSKKDMIILFVFIVGAIYFMNAPAYEISSVGKFEKTMMVEDMRYGGGYYPIDYNEPGYTTQDEQRLRKDASLNTDVNKDEFDKAKDKINMIIKENDGFYFYQNEHNNINNIQNPRDRRTYSIRFKVPTEKFENTLDRLKTVGDIVYMNMNSNDMTTQYKDLERTIQAQKDKIGELESLLLQTEDPYQKSNILTKINNLKTQLSQFESQKTGMERQTDYSTITMTLTEQKSTLETFGEFAGFEQLAKNAIRSINNVLIFVSKIIGYALFAVLVILGYKYYKRRTNDL